MRFNRNHNNNFLPEILSNDIWINDNFIEFKKKGNFYLPCFIKPCLSPGKIYKFQFKFYDKRENPTQYLSAKIGVIKVK